jgi:DNA repair exonuclease SbcCD ATPase subunit
LDFQVEFEQLEKKVIEMKRTIRSKQEKILELEQRAGTEKENVSSNIAKGVDFRALEVENLTLKKKLQEIEEKSHTDDAKASAKSSSETTEELKELRKKYDMTRRLCNLRNDDISKLKIEHSVATEKLRQLQTLCTAKEEENRFISDKYSKAKQICQLRLDKLNELRARLGQSTLEED